MLTPTQSVATTVLEHSECAEIFQRHRIDFCCRGAISIERAAQERGVELGALMQELSSAIAARTPSGGDVLSSLSTSALVEYIVGKHHAYLHRTLPFLTALAAKVARVHGERNPALRSVDRHVGELSATLLIHLDDEEVRLFPMLSGAAATREAKAREVAAMREEHLGVAALLHAMHVETDGYAAPPWACASYRTLMSELAALERDLFTHIHLENHVLAPRFEWPAEPR